MLKIAPSRLGRRVNCRMNALANAADVTRTTSVAEHGRRTGTITRETRDDLFDNLCDLAVVH